ncbi:MAG: ComF family protein [Bacteroidetes bacterium]|nr:ComF family protein [Bacteroidota bacterium]
MNFLKGLIDLFFPEICIYCNQNLVKTEKIICTFCEAQLPVSDNESFTENKIIKSLWGRVNIEFAAYYLNFKKGGITQQILHFLKYKNRKDIGIFYGKRLGFMIINEKFIKEVDYIVPVPLHKTKLRKRGYNQSAEISKGLCEVLKIPVLENNLIRISNTQTQTRKKRFERWTNVSTNFIVKNPALFEDKNLLLVDDVFTTGATIEACCQPLININNVKIGLVFLAVAG